MSGFRKLCSVVFVLALVLSVGALGCAWFDVEPVAGAVEGVRGQQWFSVTLLVLLAVDALGAVVVLLRAVMTRSRRSYQETQTDLGKITISKAAVRHVVDDVVYAHPELKGIKTLVYIKNGRKPSLSVVARVAPRGLVSVDEVGQQVQSEVKEAVEKLTGVTVSDVWLDVRENKDLSDVMEDEEGQEQAEAQEAEGLDGSDGDANAAEPEAESEATPDGGVENASSEGSADGEAGSDDADVVTKAPQSADSDGASALVPTSSETTAKAAAVAGPDDQERRR